MYLKKRNKIFAGIICSLFAFSAGISGYSKIFPDEGMDKEKIENDKVNLSSIDESYHYPKENNLPIANEKSGDILGGIALNKKVLGILDDEISESDINSKEDSSTVTLATLFEEFPKVNVLGDISYSNNSNENKKINEKVTPMTLKDKKIQDESDEILTSSSLISLNKVDKFIDDHPDIQQVETVNYNYYNNGNTYIYADAFQNPFATSEMAYGFPGYIMPTEGWISSDYGYRIHPIYGTKKFHSGVDIAVDYGTPIHASNFGIVTEAGWESGFGNKVVIAHTDGIETLYGHNQDILVKEGDFVYQGQTIALAGSTGNSTGPHCHFTMKKDGELVNPMDYVVR